MQVNSSMAAVDSLDQRVLTQLREWLAAGGTHWLCTVIATYGSSPRPVGSLLAVAAGGQIEGSLSGGCIEEDLVDKLRRGELGAGLPEVVEYGVSAADNERLGLPCGGRLQLLIEKCQRRDVAMLDKILAQLVKRACITRQLSLASGVSELLLSGQSLPLRFDQAQLSHTYGPRFQLILIGAGQLSISLAEMAQRLDYRVVVCDPRQEMIAQWPVPGVELIQGMPDDVIRERAGDPFSIIITLTHDPRIDDMALMEALTTPAFYIGALGSIKTTETRLQRLTALGLTPSQLARLHAPVGLSIGSKTPPEIAISILAELTRLRADTRQGNVEKVQ